MPLKHRIPKLDLSVAYSLNQPNITLTWVPVIITVPCHTQTHPHAIWHLSCETPPLTIQSYATDSTGLSPRRQRCVKKALWRGCVPSCYMASTQYVSQCTSVILWNCTTAVKGIFQRQFNPWSNATVRPDRSSFPTANFSVVVTSAQPDTKILLFL